MLDARGAGLEAAQAWTERRTFAPEVAAGFAVDPVEALQGRTVGVVLPARDEASTIGAIIEAVLAGPVEDGLVREVVVVDSHSRDATAKVALAAGAQVVACTGDARLGKGDALRTGIAALSSDVGVFLDADVTDFDPDVVRRLVGPLLLHDDIALVKGFYDRPWVGGTGGGDLSGGRVTELVARPLLAARHPELSGVAQPLAGEVAFRRGALGALPVVSGYGVDVGHLLAVLRTQGLDALAQVDLGERRHRHQDLAALGRMALQVAAAFDLVDGPVGATVEDVQALPRRDASGGLTLLRTPVTTTLLPPPLA